MRVAAALASLMLPACGLMPSFEELGPMAAHSVATYVWMDDDCQPLDNECAEAKFEVPIERARSSDRDVIETSIDGRGHLHLTAHGPGDALVTLHGEGSTRRDLAIRVASIDAIAFTERRVVDGNVLLLPGATAAFGFEIVDVDGEELIGFPALELRATQGAVVRSLYDRQAIAVTAPGPLGAFAVMLDGPGILLAGNVVEEGDIDGITVARNFVAPTIGGQILAAGDVERVITPLASGLRCEVDLHDWGIAPPYDSPYGGDADAGAQGDEAEVWFVSSRVVSTGNPCDLRMVLPHANGGAGLTTTLDF